MSKAMAFCHLRENMQINISKNQQILQQEQKQMLQKAMQATGDLIGNEIADKITSIDKTKNQEKVNDTNKRQVIYIAPEESQQIIDNVRLFQDHIKMEYQKTTNLPDTTTVNAPRFITEKWIKVNDQSGSAEDTYKSSKQIRFKTSMLRSDPCDQIDACIVVQGDIALTKAASENLY